MEAGRLNAIDWRAPWLAPLAPYAALCSDDGWPARLNAVARERGLATARGLPLAFAAAGDAGAAAYEAHIAATGRVPTRPLLHDLFNALMWLAWPHAKAALNAAQAAAIARDGVRGQRGARRDALTLLDESGLVLACADRALANELVSALAAHDWQRALVELRPLWGRVVQPRVFGHALLEKLAAPYKGITASVAVLAVDEAAGIDAQLAALIADPQLAPARLLHLPVLGIPGWWPANADPAFYDDPAVFRPRRASRAAALTSDC